MKKTYNARLEANYLTSEIVQYLKDQKIDIVNYSDRLKILTLESEIDLLDKEIDYLEDVEEDKTFKKAVRKKKS